MFEVNLVVHSKYSEPSNKFLNLVQELLDFEYENEVQSNTVVIPIDYQENGNRPNAYYELIEQMPEIDRVPTLILQNTTDLLTGQSAFDWVNKQIKKYKKLPGLTPSTSNASMSMDKFTPFGTSPRELVPENQQPNDYNRKKVSEAFENLQEERNRDLRDNNQNPTNKPAPWTTQVTTNKRDL